MTHQRPTGLFFTGTDTGVGKTYVAALVARALAAAGRRVGVYKPVASGCRREGGQLVSDDAVSLWEAAGRPGELERVCPQRFAAPPRPTWRPRAEGGQVDADLLRRGLEYWRERSEIVIVEGAGGLMSPVSDEDYVADLAQEFGYPLLVVARNALGVINQTLQTLDRGRHIPPGAADCWHRIEQDYSAGGRFGSDRPEPRIQPRRTSPPRRAASAGRNHVGSEPI